MEELNQAMIETEIKKETKDAIIENTIKNVTNLEVQTALGIAKIKETNKNKSNRSSSKQYRSRYSTKNSTSNKKNMNFKKKV